MSQLSFTPVHNALWVATVVQAFSRGCVIVIAKAFNEAIAASFTPELACTPPWRDLNPPRAA